LHNHTHTAQDTEDFGWQLACACPADERALVVVYLEGELGAGKTTFARGFLRAFGVTQPVRSPTYTLLEPYETPRGTLLHIDLYRLHDPSELEPLGLRDFAREGYVWLIEWPDRAGGQLPPADLALSFAVGDSGHDIEVTPRSVLGDAWLLALTGAPHSRG
jgi:tRNA threonylcarbamoyladenosine biosynthesis protein TsaE